MWNKNHMNQYLPFTPSIYNYSGKYQRGYWIQRNGDCIKISRMTLSHINNSIAMIWRYCKSYKLNPECYVVYNKLVKEQNKRLGFNE